MSIGEQIRRVRKNAGLSRRQLSERSGVSETAISQYERGVRKSPQSALLAKIADAMGVSVDFLLGKSNNNIAQLRNEKGMSRQELADALGITLDSLVDIETGKKPIPNLRTMGDLGGVLGAGIQDVLSDVQMQEIRSLAAAFDTEEARKMIKLGLATSEYLQRLHELGVAPKAYDVDAFPVEGITKLANMVVVICEGILAMAHQAESDITPHTTRDEPK